MVDDTNRFHNELKTHLEQFSLPDPPPKLPVTVFVGGHEGRLTIKYQHPKKGAADHSEIAKDAAKFTGVAATGAVGGIGVGAIIGKAIFGAIVARVGVASAGVAVGMPLLTPFVAVGAAVATAAYAGHRLATLKNDRKDAKILANRLLEHAQSFNPSVPYPHIEIYVRSPNNGLAALWQPNTDSAAPDEK